ncbi:MAG: hypothetical protein JNM84_21050 [Planctomycetes bacterium]|nr:hypothetical protein [Planctomycetota bacterium]
MKPSLLGALLLALPSGALAQQPLPYGFAIARDPFAARAGLQLVEHASGTTLELGALADPDLAGLAEAPDGRLFSFDPATAELVELSRVDGRELARTALGVPAPGAGAPCGLAVDARGRVLVACGSPAQLYEIDLAKPQRAKLRAALEDEAIGLAALGDGLLALLRAPTRAVLALEPATGALVPLTGVALPDFTGGDLDYDASGKLYAIDREGALLAVDPVSGAITRSPLLVLDEARGFSLPTTPFCAYVFEDDGRGALARLDLTSGRLERLPANSPRRAIALAAARDGRLLALDDEADRVLAVDPLSGATTPLELPLGFDVSGGGLAFDAAQNLWLADASGALFLVDDVRGSAVLRGNLAHAIQSLAFDGARLLGLEGDRVFVIDAANVVATPLPSALGGFGAAGGFLGASAANGLFGLTRAGILFGASGSSGAGLFLARTALSSPRGCTLVPCPAGLGTLALEQVQLSVSRSGATLGSSGTDSWTMRGTLPSAGLPADRTGVELEVFLNGRSLAARAALDERGRFRSERGAEPALDLRLDGDGSFDLRFEAVDLARLVPFADGTARLPLVVHVDLAVSNSSLAAPRTRARAVLDATAREGLDVRAKLARAGNGAQGVCAIDVAHAREIVDLSHRLRVKGELQPPGGGPLELIDDPRTERDVRITFGATAIEISYDEFKVSGSKLRYVDRRRSLIGGLRELEIDLARRRIKVLTYPLVDTGLPSSGSGSPTAVAVPFSVRVATPNGPLFFATELDLRRKKDTAKTWERGAR